jgi:hypothetical protein
MTRRTFEPVEGFEGLSLRTTISARLYGKTYNTARSVANARIQRQTGFWLPYYRTKENKDYQGLQEARELQKRIEDKLVGMGMIRA